jgi:hypothetical protein
MVRETDLRMIVRIKENKKEKNVKRSSFFDLGALLNLLIVGQSCGFLTVHYFNSFVPIAQQAGQAAVLGLLSISMCLWVWLTVKLCMCAKGTSLLLHLKSKKADLFIFIFFHFDSFLIQTVILKSVSRTVIVQVICKERDKIYSRINFTKASVDCYKILAQDT